MIKVIRYEELGSANYQWLHARFHFSFGQYFNKERMGFGVLRVTNDDIIQAHTGFDLHPHQDMEIITYVRSGAITHGDNRGNGGRTEAGSVQVMSAGTGIYHSEHNREDVPTTLYQIWIIPNKFSVEPRWDTKTFPTEPVNQHLHLLVSGNKEDTNALFIYQDAEIYGGRINKGHQLKHSIKRQAYLLVSSGEIELNHEVTLRKGDAAEITDESEIHLLAVDNAEVLVIDVPPFHE